MGAPARVLRHADPHDLVEGAAGRLVSTLAGLQAEQEVVNLCLTGGTTANAVYARAAEQFDAAGVEPEALSLWWTDERFLPISDPERNSLQSLSVLARTVRLAGAHTHPMPASDGHADPDEAAFAYADELGETVFDLCLLGMGADGHVASLFPDHPSSEPTSSLAIGVTDSPVPPRERISLTLNALNRSRRVWLWVSGEQKAEAVARALAGDERLPAARVGGSQETLWMVDDQAASLLPRYHCIF